MSTHTARPAADIAPSAPARPTETRQRPAATFEGTTMHSTPHQPAASTNDAAAAHELPRQATRRAAAAACGAASPLQAPETAEAAPFWRALSDESAIWMLMTLPPRRKR
jgi:hypothetical protein